MTRFDAQRRSPAAAGGLLVSALLVIALTVTACASRAGEAGPAPSTTSMTASPPPSPRPSPTGAPTSDASEPLTLVVIGDSNSTGYTGTIERGIEARTAWVAFLPTAQFTYIGGWAVDGATTTEMADAATAVPETQLVIIMGGTNDIGRGVPEATTLAEVSRIADTVGAPNVAVSAIAPLDYDPDAAVALNASMQAFAAQRGWLFVDPWVTLRSPDGTWVPAYRTDGLHTSAEGYAVAAGHIAAQLSELVP